MSEPILWPQFFFRAAVDYIVARNEKPAIIVDNLILRDGVLSTREKVSGDDCVICISPAHVANFEINPDGVSFSARFNGFYHHLEIPYEAISAVYAYKQEGMLTDSGEINLFMMPKVVLPVGAVRRNARASEKAHPPVDDVLIIEDQPADVMDTPIPNVASFKR